MFAKIISIHLEVHVFFPISKATYQQSCKLQLINEPSNIFWNHTGLCHKSVKWVSQNSFTLAGREQHVYISCGGLPGSVLLHMTPGLSAVPTASHPARPHLYSLIQAPWQTRNTSYREQRMRLVHGVLTQENTGHHPLRNIQASLTKNTRSRPVVQVKTLQSALLKLFQVRK